MKNLDVKELRTQLNLTQEKLAKKLGVSVRTVQNWESGAKIPETKHAILHSLTRSNPIAGVSIKKNMHDENTNDARQMLDLLASKEESLHKSQDQIDRLITMVEKMTDKLTAQ